MRCRTAILATPWSAATMPMPGSKNRGRPTSSRSGAKIRSRPAKEQYVYYDNAFAYFDEADNRYKRPIVTRHFRSSWDMYDRHLYPGGACRLHTLRCELGDEVFWAAVSDYLARYEGKVVETDDFRHVMEAHSGRSLARFFDQWFHTPGYPDLKVTFRYDADKQQGIFEVEQKQVNAARGHSSLCVADRCGLDDRRRRPHAADPHRPGAPGVQRAHDRRRRPRYALTRAARSCTSCPSTLATICYAPS